ncbi:MAG: hypothetical protein LBQ49_00470 [Rickettsiales bacterium]|jgi:hypothetical protein|nr:hypothetical protein [Rickettsiales bacterium]
MERFMKSRKFYTRIQGWLGGLCLLASVAFLLMTFSLSAAFADPIQMQTTPEQTAPSPRNNNPRSANPRASRGGGTVAATGGVRAAEPDSKSASQTQSARGVAARANTQATVARTTAGSATQANRNVRSRAASVKSVQGARSRNVAARTGVQQARISLTGSAIRAGTAITSSNLRTQLSSVTFSNLVDPNTGMLSADVYSQCINSYYTCMDEICAARNPGQRRCACAGRVKTFNTVEATLQSAKEDLLKVSGELSLLISSKGEAITAAFQLTDAEKSLNCVSYRDTVRQKGASSQSVKDWCVGHNMAETCATEMNNMCNGVYGGTGNAWMDLLNGADSDIISSLTTYASTIDKVNTINETADTQFAWISGINNVDSIVNGSSGIFTSETSVDTLAQTWGYDLFAYGHNNVCGRVLDSCFNGVYERCGSWTDATGTTGKGPHNLNSKISVNDNDVTFSVSKGSTTESTATAACYGYTGTSDPYSTLRGPIADARLSVLQKYVLDANADCDLYGEELKTQAQNMAYQKIAATSLLQQKRLEFAQAKESGISSAVSDAKESYKSCVSEIYECYDQQTRTNASWTAARIRNYCAMSAEIPSCFNDMVCDLDAKEVVAVADDLETCNNSRVTGENTCRNIVNRSEILAGIIKVPNNFNPHASKNSMLLREYCLQNTPGVHGTGSIRDFGTGWGPGTD